MPSLAACASKHCGFPLAEVIRRVTGQTPGVTNAREQAGARCGISDGGVAALINGYAGHKPPYPVAAIAQSLLLRRGGGKSAAGNIELIPANRSRSVAGKSALRSDPPTTIPCHRVLINDWRHDFIAKGLDAGGCSLLRHDAKPSGIRECVDERVD